MKIDTNKIHIDKSKDLTFHHKQGFWRSFIYEQSGDLNLSQLLAVIMCLVGCAVVLYVNIFNPTKSIAVEIASFSFLGAAFSLTLLAAIPTDKEKILANAKVPGDVSRGISEAALNASQTLSTDIEEIKSRTTDTNTPTTG